MKAKIWLWTGVAVLTAGIVAGAVWWKMRPQIVLLSNGTKLKLVAVSYGKHHNFPGNRVPVRANRRGGAFDSTNDTLFVWIEQQHPDNQWPNYQLLVYDRANSACAGYSMMTARQSRPGDDMVGIRLDAFPRRAGKFYLRIQEWNPQNGRQTFKNGFVLSNPARGHFPDWYPEPLPNTQSDGDLDVTLTRLVFGAKSPYNRNPDAPDDPINQAVLAAFQIQQNGRTATNWQPAQVETSDATGNHITGWGNSHWENDEQVTLYQWGLWPDEPAWKLRVEFSRTSGFNDDELWTVQNVPVQAGHMQDFWNYGRNRTNDLFAETTLNGSHLRLYSAKQFTDQQNMRGSIEGGLRVEANPMPQGMRMTLVRVTDDHGRELRPMSWSSGGNESRFGLQELGNTKTLNLTLALHRSRFVEFMVKPTKS